MTFNDMVKKQRDKIRQINKEYNYWVQDGSVPESVQLYINGRQIRFDDYSWGRPRIAHPMCGIYAPSEEISIITADGTPSRFEIGICHNSQNSDVSFRIYVDGYAIDEGIHIRTIGKSSMDEVIQEYDSYLNRYSFVTE